MFTVNHVWYDPEATANHSECSLEHFSYTKSPAVPVSQGESYCKRSGECCSYHQ